MICATTSLGTVTKSTVIIRARARARSRKGDRLFSSEVCLGCILITSFSCRQVFLEVFYRNWQHTDQTIAAK